MTKIYQNHNKFIQLRQNHPEMIVHLPQYKLVDNKLIINYLFEFPDKFSFSPKSTITFPTSKKIHFPLHDVMIEFLAALAMVESISYWKTVCPPKIVTKGFALSSSIELWWKKLFFHGLGEFFYTNGINTSELCDLISIYPKSEQEPSSIHIPFFNEHEVIVPIGGGKDSVVTLELLLKDQYSIVPLIINPRVATIKCIEAAGFTRADIIEIDRKIDPLLLELNAKDYLNGHTPFSAMLAFYSSLSACIAGIKFVALSNESSANESTVLGQDINHQYSKSFEFESDFRQYLNDYLIRDIEYFSFLRPISELQIAGFFSSYIKYHSVFKSCNVGSKKDEWCGSCPKCLFTAVILSPFMSIDAIEKIFGKDILNDTSLIGFLDELCGNSPVKPFECVGTIDEVNLALSVAIKYNVKKDLPKLFQHYINTKEITDNIMEVFYRELNKINPDHFVPRQMMGLIIDNVKRNARTN